VTRNVGYPQGVPKVVLVTTGIPHKESGCCKSHCHWMGLDTWHGRSAPLCVSIPLFGQHLGCPERCYAPGMAGVHMSKIISGSEDVVEVRSACIAALAWPGE